MDLDEALKLLKGGVEGTEAWNRRRDAGEEIPNLEGANLEGADLGGADLSDANLSEANLIGANLEGADLNKANLNQADFWYANFCEANLREANLSEANLNGAILRQTTLDGARLPETRLAYVLISDCDLSGVDLTNVVHIGPSDISTHTLIKSKGKIPEIFLRGCGLSPWEVELCRLYDDSLTAEEVSELLSTKVFLARSNGAFDIGGVFISYSTKDAKFAEKIRSSLYDAGASVWLDRHARRSMERQSRW